MRPNRMVALTSRSPEGYRIDTWFGSASWQAPPRSLSAMTSSKSRGKHVLSHALTHPGSRDMHRV